MKNNYESLRKSIIDLAVKGLLIPQLDESPFVLPEKHSKDDFLIFADEENEYYYYDKKGKKVKIQEVPFDLPKGWRFAQFKCLYDLYTGNSIPQSVKENKYAKLKKEDGYPYIGTKDVGFNHLINYDNGVYIPFDEDFRHAYPGNTLLCIEGGSAGKKIGITNQEVCFGNKLMCFKPKYIEFPITYWYLQSPSFSKLFKDSTTGMITGISKKNLENLLLPIPPLEEQIRISNKLNQLDILLCEYERTCSEMEKLDSEIKLKLARSIIKAAVEGSLTLFEEGDTSVEDYFNKIVKEKKDFCVHEGIREKPTEIFVYNGSTDGLKKNWKRCYLSQVILLNSGVDLESSQYSDKKGDIPYITGASDIVNNEVLINRYTNKKNKNSYYDDLFMTCKGTIGKLAKNNIGPCHIARQLMGFKSFIDIDFLTLFLYINVNEFASSSHSLIPGISRNIILSTIIDIPCIEEQRRIVELVKNVITSIENFEI